MSNGAEQEPLPSRPLPGGRGHGRVGREGIEVQTRLGGVTPG